MAGPLGGGLPVCPPADDGGCSSLLGTGAELARWVPGRPGAGKELALRSAGTALPAAMRPTCHSWRLTHAVKVCTSASGK